MKSSTSKSGLYWEDKVEDIEKELQQKKAVLREVKSLAINNTGPEHWIIEGDNLHGLSCIKDNFKKKVDVIYIDPPYNTGNKYFKYNDHFVDPDDEFKHSKWVSFMAKRLKLSKGFLKEDGAIFISIDDAEHARLKLLCDDIFDSRNFVANFIRKNKSGSGHDSGKIAVEFDYMLCYAKNKDMLQFSKEDVDAATDNKYRHKDEHFEKRGKYYLRDLDYKGSYSPSLDYEIETPDGQKLKAGGKLGPPNTWRWNKEKVKWGIENDFIVFDKKEKGWKIYIKQYQFVDNKNQQRIRQLPYRALIEFSNSRGSSELKDIIQQDIFSYPKPTDLILFVLNLFKDRKGLVLMDFFAGSGTSLHALMLQNNYDGGSRKGILITNNENYICEQITYERNKRVIQGYTTRKGKKIESLKRNGVRYFKASFE